MRERLQGFIAGGLSISLLCAVTAFAKNSTEYIEAVYRNIKVCVDGVQMPLKDANGTSVEPFISNGTTYLPVRAVASALGLQVEWDGNTNSVNLYKNSVPDETYLMDVCPPYEQHSAALYYSSKGDSFTMGGERYSNGFSLSNNSSYVLINLNGKYKSMTFDLGHTGSANSEKIISFIADGKEIKELTIEANSTPKQVTVALNNALSLKILMPRNKTYTYNAGLGNITLR